MTTASHYTFDQLAALPAGTPVRYRPYDEPEGWAVTWLGYGACAGVVQFPDGGTVDVWHFEIEPAGAGTVTAVLSCTHMTDVPASTVLPEVAECPVSGQERDITALAGDGTDPGIPPSDLNGPACGCGHGPRRHRGTPGVPQRGACASCGCPGYQPQGNC